MFVGESIRPKKGTKMQTYSDKIKSSMIVDGNNIFFHFMDKSCGISSTVKDGTFQFLALYGDVSKHMMT